MKTNIFSVGLALAFISSSSFSADTALPVIADEVKYTLSHSELKMLTDHGLGQTVKHQGASFIKLHFKKLSLPQGALLRVKSPTTGEMVEYDKSQIDWFAQSISGDSLVIELVANAKGHYGQFELDYYMAGRDIALQEAATLSTCGENERRDVACWEGSHPDKVAWSAPVARLLINGRSLCTAWRVGPSNHMFTNNHCVDNASELKNTEVWFNYQRTSCNGSMATTVKVMGNELLSTDYTLDYTLFTVDDFSKISSFGYLGLDASEPVFGNGIYIPQHGSGNPKELSIESDKNGSGMCQIDLASANGRGTDTDTGYFCDTIGGSSGSPVLTTANNKAIALHHFGGCENQGVKISKIWPKVASYFNNVLPDGSVGLPPSDGATELSLDTPISNLSMTKGEEKMFVLRAANRNSDVMVSIASGTGDADLYVRTGQQPTRSVYDCRPYRSGNTESCEATNANEDLYVMLHAYSSFSGLTLTVTPK
ncbi:peptidase [Vibrio zhanjiangensis]|uniref:Peptidase n=1 Tax=Vibrio zhanjiangensis TaxID=1046128 RepID=A0ABQ6F4L4_9VIBR|nr:serine protease [Vibrio zhanjiangensis]GLT19726.1 peptidase [Vibrio zhanjiangensis]